jgi:release factor glutamine methyltransferase
MKLDQFLKKSETKLKAEGISSPRLDVLILLEDALHKDRSWILAHPEHELVPVQIKTLSKKIDRRAKHEPLAYIRGHTEFYGRKFKVNRHTLEPRPESETMITLLKNLAVPHFKNSKARPWKVADVGAGSGCLGITAKLEIHNLEVDLYDISASALAVAKHNAHMHELHLHGRKMNLLSRPLRPYDIILANLPYIPEHWKFDVSISHEPKIAFSGGSDGLDVYRKLFGQLKRFAWKPSFVFCESMPPQHKELAKIAAEASFKLHQSEDFIQVFKNT